MSAAFDVTKPLPGAGFGATVRLRRPLAEGVPTGLCYQRLAHGDEHVLHGLVAVHLNGAWHRQDPRGNKDGVDAQFSLDEEQLAWDVDPTLGEIDYPTIFAEPAECVVDTLRGTADVLSLYDVGLPTGL